MFALQRLLPPRIRGSLPSRGTPHSGSTSSAKLSRPFSSRLVLLQPPLCSSSGSLPLRRSAPHRPLPSPFCGSGASPPLPPVGEDEESSSATDLQAGPLERWFSPARITVGELPDLDHRGRDRGRGSPGAPLPIGGRLGVGGPPPLPRLSRGCRGQGRDLGPDGHWE